ncbi:activating signal cointegrator 1 complex subunit 2 homolog isoform X2 [Anneissia japonica]|uniref:activating signal cointegrator 1 complex subunit 2 homolog isoform X2 n=1 Tax=Anneissia japonica TaxID=1529436 RepID=UPI0014255A52|nr:activating signal cointegrator 1 complex subunit 2 homolog isoform X2 [Anneissia japonica]
MVNVHWSDAATYALISVWGNSKIQNGFDGTRRNGAIYGQIKAKMDELGFVYELCQIVNKCKNLKRLYLEAKDDQNKSGHGPAEWQYFAEMDDIFGDRPATNPTYVAGSALPRTSTPSSSRSAAGRRPTTSQALESEGSSNRDPPNQAAVNPGLDDSGVQEDAEPDTVATNQKRKCSTKSGRKKAKTSLVSELSEVFQKSNQEFRAQLLEDQRKAAEAKRELEREREEREERMMMRMHELSSERQMRMIQALGMMLRPAAPQTFPQPTQYNAAQQSYEQSEHGQRQHQTLLPTRQEGYWPRQHAQHHQPQHHQPQQQEQTKSSEAQEESRQLFSPHQPW